jgi:hypothetical protein
VIAPHWETVTATMRRVLEVVGQSDLVPDFYLAGGTALALQIGHRCSIDLDFFSATDEVRPETHRRAARMLVPFQPAVVEATWGNLVFATQDGLRVGFFGYGYPLIEPTMPVVGTPLASLVDIGLMKLDALATRAGRKDFCDLYAISQRISLRDLLDRAPEKYPGFRDFEAMVVRRTAFFERAEQEEMPSMLESVDWETVKAFFRAQAVMLGRRWIDGTE